MQWNTSYVESVFSFANNINTTEGGTHLSGFRAALTGTLNRYARDKGLLKEKEENLEGEDVREGLAAVISVKLRNPQFEGQTKTKLGNPPIESLVKTVVNQRLAEFLEENPTEARQIISRRFRRPRTPGRAEGARAHAPQERAGELVAAGQARGLLAQGRGPLRALHRGGGLRRRLGEAGARSHLPGDPAASREDHQQREEPHQQGALQHRDPGDDHGDRDRVRRRVHDREPALRPGHRDDRRRRGRRAHPHAGPDVPLPARCGSSSSADTCTSRCRRSTTSSSATRSSTSRRTTSSRSSSRASGSRTSTVVDRKGTELRSPRPAGAVHPRALRARGLAGEARARTTAPQPTSSSPIGSSRRARPRPPRRGRDRGDPRQRLRAVRHRAARGQAPGQGRRDRDERGDASRLPAGLFGSPSYAKLRRAYEKLTEVVGLPDFKLTYGKKTAVAESFAELRDAGARAREGGDADQPLQGARRDEPRAALGDDDGSGRSRMLLKVEVEDAAAADRVFSMLMGSRSSPSRLHRSERKGREVPRCLMCRARGVGPHRVPRARAGDALELPRLRDVA